MEMFPSRPQEAAHTDYMLFVYVCGITEERIYVCVFQNIKAFLFSIDSIRTKCPFLIDYLSIPDFIFGSYHLVCRHSCDVRRRPDSCDEEAALLRTGLRSVVSPHPHPSIPLPLIGKLIREDDSYRYKGKLHQQLVWLTEAAKNKNTSQQQRL